MELILKAAEKEIPCLDWPTALVGLRTIDNAIAIERIGAPEGKVGSVFLMRWTHPNTRPLWVGIAKPTGVNYLTDPSTTAAYLDRLMAGEDV